MIITLYFYFNLILIILSAYVEYLFGKYSWGRYVYYSEQILKLVEKCGAKVRIEGKEVLEKIVPPVVFVSNHMSSLETLIFGGIIGKFLKFTFVIKKSLLYYPFFNRMIKFLNPIVVSRKHAKKDFAVVLSQAKFLFDNKISLVVFPQATRSIEINENKFSSLAVKLVERFGLSIVPICVKTDFLSIGKIIKDIGKVVPQNDVRIKIFPEITHREINKQTNKKIIELFKTTLTKWSRSY